MISILIVNYNTGSILEKCIDSLFRFEDAGSFEVIIVDNSSGDNSRDIINKLSGEYSNVISFFTEKKISFSEANNKAFGLSKGEYILIMNPDIIFTEPLFEKLITDLSKDKTIGVVCPMLIGTDGKFQSGYFQKYPTLKQYIFFYSVVAKMFLSSKSLVNKYLENGNITPGNAIINVEQIPCAFFFMPREVFEQAGGMDNSYELFFEDVDLSYKINKSKRLAIDTSLSVTHLGGESFKKSDDYWLYGRFILSMINFFSKHYSNASTSMLKFVAKTNSRIILSMESIKKIFGKHDDYRIRKHKYFLQEYKTSY